MTSQEQSVINEAKSFVTTLFTNDLSESFVFHNLDHTLNVVKASETIASKYSLTETEYFSLILASWFHDTGYVNGKTFGHEDASKKYATDFMKQQDLDEEVIKKVNNCILATKMPQTPSNNIERIICDADLYHLGDNDFDDKNKLLRKEINMLQDEKLSKKEWRKKNIDFLRRHRYFTEYGQQFLEPVKQKHLHELLSGLDKKDKKEIDEEVAQPQVLAPNVPEDIEGLEKSEEKIKKKQKEVKLPERGIVAMFRIMSQNHVNLSEMADSKANIMISVNTIVMSIMVSLLLGKLQFYPEFILPTVILIFVCLGAVVFAILATRPNITGGTFTKEDIAEKKINLLFFGNFFRMKLYDYEWAMMEMMKDREYLYGSMTKDIYFLGIVLARKYRLLRISYNIFMFGLIIAVFSFAIAFLFSDSY
jgi:predicted metal-dependent HD superfamily phosphohydrolase